MSSQLFQPVAGPNQNRPNHLINGAFDFWQAGTSITIANTVSTYQPDQWYGKNSLGTNGILTLAQVAGVTDGSKYGASLKISTAPTVAQANGCELYQVLSNQASLALYNQSASFTVLVKALNNVTQVGVQFYYKTTEAKVDTSIGSEVLTTVNSSTFTACTINNQALGSSMTTSGVVGVRIRITGVSSGNLYDINNGFVCEQAMVNVGPLSSTFQRQANNPAEELVACQYFLEVLGSSAATTKPIAMGTITAANTTANFILTFRTLKRTNATLTFSAHTHFNVVNAAINQITTAMADAGSGVDAGNIQATFSTTAAAQAGSYLLTNNTAARVYIDARI